MKQRLVTLLILLLSYCLSLNASDTLRLSQWSLRNESLNSPIPFQGARNILHVIREAQTAASLNARFSKQSREFHDSVASLEHTIISEFELNRSQRKASSIELQLDYLQTFTDIYVNDHFIGKTNNAFLLWKFILPQKILKQRNTIRIEFHPPRETVLPLVKRTFKLPADNQKDSIKTAPFIRQPQQEFGWDFCYPEIFTGFRMAPRLVFRKDQHIESIRVETKSIAHGNAWLQIHLRGNAGKKKTTLHLQADSTAAIRVVLPPGDFDTIIDYHIPKARLWWPNQTHEGPRFYHLKASFQNGHQDTLRHRFGIRTVDLIREKDSIGTSFYFKINNEALYMQGANVVMPNEVFEGNRACGLSKKELSFVRSTGMNMLRIWGGGTYLPDAFYDWADENGVLIWQDFMFACTYYPVDDAMLEVIRDEIRYQTERLSAHPCLALLCGNNEIDVARKNWGWEQTHGYSVPQKSMLDGNYEFLFERFIPEIVEDTKSSIPYLASSPVSNWGKLTDFDSGDNHDWGIWHGELPFDGIYKRIPRFMSEYGFPSLPPLNILEKYLGLEAAEIQPESLVLSYKGMATLQRYIRSKGYPSASLEEIILSSQEVQVWHYQKMKSLLRDTNERCMGNLWWQLNSVSPVMSWALIDLLGNPLPALAK
jgi:beta-mannosidase